MSGILLSTHGGGGADGAATLAGLLAKRRGIALTAMVVYEPPPVADYGYGLSYVLTSHEEEEIMNELTDAAHKQLQRVGAKVVKLVSRVGVVASEVGAAARTLDADLIVAGLGPHNILDRALGGETALHLAQSARTPVLAVPASVTSLPRRVMAATDFSETSLLAARAAVASLVAGDTLVLAHVRPPSKGGPTVPRDPKAGISAEKLAGIRDKLGALTGLNVELVEREGEPARTLLELAKTEKIDLIALGSHGYGPIKRLLVGSVASKIIRTADVCVLVAPMGVVR